LAIEFDGTVATGATDATLRAQESLTYSWDQIEDFVEVCHDNQIPALIGLDGTAKLTSVIQSGSLGQELINRLVELTAEPDYNDQKYGADGIVIDWRH